MTVRIGPGIGERGTSRLRHAVLTAFEKAVNEAGITQPSQMLRTYPNSRKSCQREALTKKLLRVLTQIDIAHQTHRHAHEREPPRVVVRDRANIQRHDLT
jgi:hypothetical protein